MAVEEWDRGWTTCADYRGVNANMHGVEAMLAAADAVADADTAARLRGQALRTTERVVHGWARDADWRLPEHFTARWEPLPDYNRDRPADPFRPYGVTSGTSSNGRVSRCTSAPSLDGPAGLAAGRRRRAVRRRGDPGLGRRRRRRLPVHARLGRPAGRRRPHALGALRGGRRGDGAGRGHRANRATGSSRAAGGTTARRCSPTPPPAAGTTSSRRPARSRSGTWAGQPDAYHLAQMLLFDGRPVRGSVAAALR